MSEQRGRAAGTAEPNEPPESINFNKPWKISHRNPALILDRDGMSLAHVMSVIAGTYQPRPVMEIKAIAQHIVACVNFCSQLDSELVEALSGDEYRLSCKRIDPDVAAELADNSQQFHADQASKNGADKPVAVLTAGGAI
jgi:hypothetical protein